MRAVGLFALCLISSAKSEKSKDLKYIGKGNQASPDVLFDPSTGKFVNHQPFEAKGANHRSQKLINTIETVELNSLADISPVETNFDVYDSFTGFKNSPGPQNAPPVKFDFFDSSEYSKLESKTKKYPSYHFTIGDNDHKDSENGTRITGQDKIVDKDKTFNLHRDKIYPDDQKSEHTLTPFGDDDMSSTLFKRYHYDFTIGEDPNMSFRGYHSAENISKNKAEIKTSHSTTTKPSEIKSSTSKRTTTSPPKRSSINRQMITRRPSETERSTTTSTSDVHKGSQTRQRLITTNSTSSTNRPSLTTTESSVNLSFLFNERLKLDISDDKINERKQKYFQSKSKKKPARSNYFANERNEVISDIYPEDESAKFPHFPAKKNLANFDDLPIEDDHDDESADLKLPIMSMLDNEPLPSIENYVRSTTSPPPDFEHYEKEKPAAKVKLHSRPNLDTSIKQQEIVNLLSKKYHPYSGKSTPFGGFYKNFENDNSYEKDDIDSEEEEQKRELHVKDPILKNPSINLPPRPNFNLNVEQSSFSLQDTSDTQAFPSFQSNFLSDVKNPVNKPLRSYYSQPVQHYGHQRSHGTDTDSYHLKTNSNRVYYDDGNPQEEFYPSFSQPFVPKRGSKENLDLNQYQRKERESPKDLTNFDNSNYGFAKASSFQSVTFPTAPKSSNHQYDNFSTVSTSKASLVDRKEKSAAPVIYFGPNRPGYNQPASVRTPTQDVTKNIFPESEFFQSTYTSPGLLESKLEQYPILHDNPLLPFPMEGYSAPDLYGKDIPRLKRKEPSKQNEKLNHQSSFFPNFQNEYESLRSFAYPPATTTIARTSNLEETRGTPNPANDHATYHPYASPSLVPNVSIKTYGEPVQVSSNNWSDQFHQREKYGPTHYPEIWSY